MTNKQKLKQLLNTPELMQLLQDEQWDELMNKLPIQTRSVLLELLRDCGVEENEVTQLQLEYGIMYGLKTYGSTVAINSPVNGVHNVGIVSNQGMQGGRQLGFLTVKQAEEYGKKIDSAKGVTTHVYIMQPKTVKEYIWKEVDTIFGKAVATTHATSQFVGRTTPTDPKIIAKSLKAKIGRLKKKQEAAEYEVVHRYYNKLIEPIVRKQTAEIRGKCLEVLQDIGIVEEAHLSVSIYSATLSFLNLYRKFSSSYTEEDDYIRIGIWGLKLDYTEETVKQLMDKFDSKLESIIKTVIPEINHCSIVMNEGVDWSPQTSAWRHDIQIKPTPLLSDILEKFIDEKKELELKNDVRIEYEKQIQSIQDEIDKL